MARYLAFFLLIVFFSSCKKDRAYVVSQIKDVAKLSTTEMVVDKIIFGTDDKRILGLIKVGEAEFFAKSEATIKAGIDLNKIKYEEIKIEGDRIELKLPPVEVINFSYPFEKFEIDTSISRLDRFFNKITIEEQEHFYQQAELEIRNSLQFLGLVERTEENTRKLLQGMLMNIGFKEIYIEFEKSEKLIYEINLENA